MQPAVDFRGSSGRLKTSRWVVGKLAVMYSTRSSLPLIQRNIVRLWYYYQIAKHIVLSELLQVVSQFLKISIQVVHTLSNLCLTVPSGATSDLLTLQVLQFTTFILFLIPLPHHKVLDIPSPFFQHCSNDQSQQWKMAEQDWSDS